MSKIVRSDPYLTSIDTDADRGAIPSLTFYEKQVGSDGATSNTVFTLSKRYVQGTNTLMVFVNGQKAEYDATPADATQYNETSNTSITFGASLLNDDVIEFMVVGAYHNEDNNSIVDNGEVGASYTEAGSLIGNYNGNQNFKTLEHALAIYRDGDTDKNGLFAINSTGNMELYIYDGVSAYDYSCTIREDGINTAQVKFPATQVASTDDNTLDDYEEGTFTPSLTINDGTTGITISSQNGFYTKVGRSVTFNFYLGLSSKGSLTGDIKLTGLPFTNIAGNSYTTVAVWASTISFSGKILAGYVNTNSSYIYLGHQDGAGGAFDILADGDLRNSSEFLISGTYHTT